MNFFDWMSINMLIDVAVIVFGAAVIYRSRKHNSMILKLNDENADLQHKIEMHRLAIIDLMQKAQSMEEQIISVTKNPQAARRKLKQSE
jgi:hypothetical protein